MPCICNPPVRYRGYTFPFFYHIKFLSLGLRPYPPGLCPGPGLNRQKNLCSHLPQSQAPSKIFLRNRYAFASKIFALASLT